MARTVQFALANEMLGAYIAVPETESLFDALSNNVADSRQWTKLWVRENGIDVIGWRLHGRVPAERAFKARLDEYFKQLVARPECPVLAIHLKHSAVRVSSMLPLPESEPYLFCPCSPPCKITDMVPCKHVCPDSQPSKPRKPMKRKAAAGPGDRQWVQRILIMHPFAFEKTSVEVASNVPMGAVMQDLCRKLLCRRNEVRFVWKHGKKDVVLEDTDAPWDVRMKRGIVENIHCDFV